MITSTTPNINIPITGKKILHELARILEQRGLLEGAELYGITEDPAQIATADEYRKLSKPPRPYLNFYLHDLHQPLDECLGLHEKLDKNKPATFDFIFGGSEVWALIRGAKASLTGLYRANLKPGGLFLSTNLIEQEGDDGWVANHPAFAHLSRAVFRVLESYNSVGELAPQIANWLAELGASQVQYSKVILEVGGTTQTGHYLLLNSIAVLRQAGPEFVKAGLITQAQYDEFIRVVYTELTPKHKGQAALGLILARKPLTVI